MEGTIIRCAWCDSLAEVKEQLPWPCPSCGHSLGVTKPACRCHQCVVQPAKSLNQSKPDKTPGDALAAAIAADPPVTRMYGQSFWLRFPDGHMGQLWLSEPDYAVAVATARVLAFAPATRDRLRDLLAAVEAAKFLSGETPGGPAVAAAALAARQAVADADGRK